jgi:hypothetical protein
VYILHGVLQHYTLQYFIPVLHHFDADSDPDPACHFDADANTDPDPGIQIQTQNLEKVLK